MTLDIDFGLDGDTFAIGANGGRASINEGLMTVSGTITAFFEDAVYLNKAASGTAVSIELILTSGTNVLSFLMPEVKFARKSRRTSCEVRGLKYSIAMFSAINLGRTSCGVCGLKLITLAYTFGLSKWL